MATGVGRSHLLLGQIGDTGREIPNLLDNPQLDAVVTGWGAYDTATVTREVAPPRAPPVGAAVCKCVTTGASYDGLTIQSTAGAMGSPVVGGRTYLGTVWADWTGSTFGATLGNLFIVWMDSGGTWIYSDLINFDVVAGWYRYGIRRVAPANAAFAYLVMCEGSNSATSRTWYATGAQLREVTWETTNLLLNSELTTGLAGWVSYWNASVVRETAPAPGLPAGFTAVAKVTTSADATDVDGVAIGDPGSSFGLVAIAPSTSYVGSVYAEFTGATGKSMTLTMSFFDAAMSYITGSPTYFTSAAGWNRLTTIPLTSPSNAAFCKLYCVEAAPSASVFTYYATGAQIEAGTAASAYVSSATEFAKSVYSITQESANLSVLTGGYGNAVGTDTPLLVESPDIAPLGVLGRFRLRLVSCPLRYDAACTIRLTPIVDYMTALDPVTVALPAPAGLSQKVVQVKTLRACTIIRMRIEVLARAGVVELFTPTLFYTPLARNSGMTMGETP